METLTQLGRIVDFGSERVEETGDIEDARTLLDTIELSLAHLRAQVELMRAAI